MKKEANDLQSKYGGQEGFDKVVISKLRSSRRSADGQRRRNALQVKGSHAQRC